MMLLNELSFKFAVLATMVSAAGASIGRVQEGVFNSESFDFDNLNDAMNHCDTFVSCAGITYRPHEQLPDEWRVYFHSFIPPLLNNTKEHDWTTIRSDKHFVYHPGKVISKKKLDIDVDPSRLSLSEASAICKNHNECVALSYPASAQGLDGFEEILFVASVENISSPTDDMDVNDHWHTLVANEESKAEKANADAMVYIEELEDRPYDTCCERVVDIEKAHLPSIEQVQQMDTLPRISCDISKEDFQAQYEFTRTPVILVGCDKDWPAKTEWTLEKLTERYRNDDTTTWRTKKIDQPGEWDDELTWNEVMEIRSQNNGVYIFDPLESSGKESIDQDYSTPTPMEGTDYFPPDFPPAWGNRRWFCLGERGSGSLPHSDPFATDAWNSLISGHKWWILYPHDVEESMVTCDPDCSPQDPETLDWYSSIGRHAARTSYANGATPMHVLQKPGETIYVPNENVHSVMNLDETIAITANYGSPGNLQKVWEATVRKGAIHHWVDMYEKTFSDEEREAVMEGDIWPPYLFAGTDPEGQQYVFNYRQGMYDEAEMTSDTEEEDSENGEERDAGVDEIDAEL